MSDSGWIVWTNKDCTGEPLPNLSVRGMLVVWCSWKLIKVHWHEVRLRGSVTSTG